MSKRTKIKQKGKISNPGLGMKSSMDKVVEKAVWEKPKKRGR